MDYRYLVVGIDGTGSRSWMNKDGSNSSTYKFIHDVHYGSMEIDRRWFNGPSHVITGSDSEPILQEALDFIYHRLATLFPVIGAGKIKPMQMFDVNSCMQHQEQTTRNMIESRGYHLPAHVPLTVTSQMLARQPLTTDDIRIVLIGHSRGGLVVTELARMLSPIVKVYFMGLYDSVDREGCLDGMTVENVKYVAHARRDPEVKSRTYFGNTSLKYIGVDHAEEQFFYTSHGGIGGSFVTKENEVGAFGDSSCLPTINIQTEGGETLQLVNNPKLVSKFGKTMDQVCADGSRNADLFIREQARKYGIPVS